MYIFSSKFTVVSLLMLSFFTAKSANAHDGYLDSENLRECIVFIYNGNMPTTLQDMYAFIRTSAYRFELDLYGSELAGKSYYEVNIPKTDLHIQIDSKLIHASSKININTRILKAVNGEKQKLFEYAPPVWDYSFGFDSYSGSYINYEIDLKQPLLKSRTGEDYYQRMSIKCYMHLEDENVD